MASIYSRLRARSDDMFYIFHHREVAKTARQKSADLAKTPLSGPLKERFSLAPTAAPSTLLSSRPIAGGGRGAPRRDLTRFSPSSQIPTQLLRLDGK